MHPTPYSIECTEAPRPGSCASRPLSNLRLDWNLRLQEFLRRFELGLELLLRDPCDDRLADFEEPTRLAVEDRYDLGSATFGLKGVGDRECKRLLGLGRIALVEFVLTHH